tara:strand:+ start:9911 stop:10102 length:192 start_codon:yes stop_codon:yes gene_type:complete
MVLKICYDCKRHTEVQLVPEFVDKETGDEYGAMLCFVCKHNRRALKNEDIRVQFGDDNNMENK